ncbi:NTP transferase domain-containing protein [Chryseobacterium indologenes]|uniref:Probable molybdenum cofactor guanylyltransferase n=2 Tax=Chryseobacterium indologenes TaxID=253 RepID=A0A1Z3VZC0_CHRID|nr:MULTISPECIES: NTP transferase domain-containing protein [Chryseobacterium]ASE60821.1 molybdenum cofactor guanylyltransferase [Chryseobacterium indologenes]ATN04933.1 molybdenum cofactor guanylyltransferase [Chryseobacterium indologenes]AYY86316.1 molybdenum cofactor guanylyltransferase [Chryseobacterium indologenes]AYZ36092.1 molybdenum cofactor guanylyltransferase [Chryseobacterium indologenes]AZB16516.1 molybdenum cofactor guanylyltransferase [Chryseobacterium indologenes]
MISEEHKMIPPLNGLVLAGGKSSRMGTAKDKLNWHGKEQRYFAADLLAPFCNEVFISCRQDQLENFDSHYNALPDTFLNMGPFGGILSALRAQRDKAWLVVACDLPLLDKKSLEFLIQSRDPEKAATTYESPFDGLPEPLITIWEPKSYPLLLNFLGTGNTCPRKVLINSDPLILKPENPDALMNVNTPEEAVKANEILKK